MHNRRTLSRNMPCLPMDSRHLTKIRSFQRVLYGNPIATAKYHFVDVRAEIAGEIKQSDRSFYPSIYHSRE